MTSAPSGCNSEPYTQDKNENAKQIGKNVHSAVKLLLGVFFSGIEGEEYESCILYKQKIYYMACVYKPPCPFEKLAAGDE